MDNYDQTYGYIAGVDPLEFVPGNAQFEENGFALFLTQALIIITLCNILGYAFQKVGQPRVLGDLLAGVLIGPTAFENIPGFKETIFPANSKPLLTLVSSFGLVTFLFLVGLETDTDLMIKYWKSVALIIVPPFALTFGVSCGVAKLIYDELTDQTVAFTTFMLFVATVMSVTSLSVLSRILAEMGILSTSLGATTVASGAGNDTLGYCLLAVASSLAGGGKQIFALYQLLAFVGWLLFLIVVWRPLLFRWIARAGIDMSPDSHDPVPAWLTLCAVLGGLVSALVSDMFGLHTLVGAFAYGAVIPHGRFGIAVTEAVEQPIVTLLLPLYFGAVGLQIDFKTLNNGTAWGLIFLLVCAIFITKSSSTAVCARISGMNWRQSMCVGALMQSKGVIEVVIGAVALQDGVISTQIFSMLFLVFLITTSTVRPLARAIYLKQANQEGAAVASAGEDSGDETPDEKGSRMQWPPNGSPEAGATEAKEDVIPITAALASANPSVEALMTFMHILSEGTTPQGSAAELENKADLSQGAATRIALDLIRVLPTEYGPASIMRLVFSVDRRRDAILATLKSVAALAGVPSSSAIAAEKRQLGLPLPDAGHIAGQEQLTVERVPEEGQGSGDAKVADTYAVTSSQVIPTILQAHRRSQRRLKSGTMAAADDGLSRNGLIICPWEATNSAARTQSWISLAASASAFRLGYSQPQGAVTEREEAALWNASADAQALPARLFAQRHANTGILVDAHVAVGSNRLELWRRSQRPSRNHSTAAARVQSLLDSADHGQSGWRRPRVLVPFFGGADDRMAVALARKIARRHRSAVDVIVVAMPSDDAVNEALNPTSPPAERPPAPPTQGPTITGGKRNSEDSGAAEAEDQETINLQTIHQAAAQQRDARFLFEHGALDEDAHRPESGAEDVGQTTEERTQVQLSGFLSSFKPSKDTPARSPLSREHSMFTDSKPTSQPQIRSVDRVHSVTLPSTASGSSPGGIVESIYSVLIPLVHSAADVIVIGRGKYGSRTAAFRAEVERLRDRLVSSTTAVPSDKEAAASGAGRQGAEEGLRASIEEAGLMGRTLGAAAEGCLLSLLDGGGADGGAAATLLVVQAAHSEQT